MTHELLSVDQAVTYLNVARGTLYKLIREGELASIKICSRRLIPRGSLETLLQRKLEGR